MSEDTDVCVVGAGAGGALAAWALVQRGVRVAVLEAGPRFDPASYGTHAQDWEIEAGPIEAVASAPERISYESAEGEALDPEFRKLRSRSPSAFSELLPRRRRPFHYSRALGVGGSTLHYQGEAHRFPAHAFRMRSERGVAADWPLGYDDLAPYYERVEVLLGVAGEAGNPFKPPRGPYPYPAHPLSGASRLVRRGARRLGWQLLPNPVAILSRARPGRARCHYCNGCVRGCMVGAKGSVDVAVLPEAERTGRLRVVPGFQAARLEHAPDGRITAVVGFDQEGRERRERARAFVLAAGAIETPRLLLNSAAGAHPHGVGNTADQVGRYLMETLYVNRLGFFDHPRETWVGMPLDSHVWDWNGAVAAKDGFPVGFVLGSTCGIFQGPVGYATEGVAGFGRAHREAMRAHFGAGVTFYGVAEQIPRAENRVTLAAEGRDRFGVPLARVETRLDATDLQALARMWEQLGRLARASGVDTFVGQMTAYDVPRASHVGGTCRLGHDPETSVVDANGAVHGVPNLVIADASVLVTQGAGDSPSLTIQALALRAAESLAERAQRGEV